MNETRQALNGAELQAPFAVVPIEVVQDERLTALQMRVLVTILSFRGRDTNLVWPKRSTIARRCGVSEQRISRATTALEELGWLTKEHGGQSRGKGRPGAYRFHIPDHLRAPEPDADPQKGVETEHLYGHIGVGTEHPKGVGTGHHSGEQTREQTTEKNNSSRAHARGGTGKREVPEDFTPSDQTLDWAKRNTPELDVQAEVDAFVDYHRAHGKRFKDHQRAFKNWLRIAQRKRAQAVGNRRPGGGQGGGKQERGRTVKDFPI